MPEVPGKKRSMGAWVLTLIIIIVIIVIAVVLEAR